MEQVESTKNQNLPAGQDTTLVRSSFRAGSSSCFRAESMPSAPQEIGVNNHIPVFLDRTFRMVEQVPDDIMCWSTAGDSFIIKQVLGFEEILPSFFNHKKFMSFVRQLNFYGFKKTKGSTWSRFKSTNRDAYREGAAVVSPADSESWEEFRHSQFRRGRRDLLIGIKRHKDGGRLKRKRADAQKSDIMSSLATDVSTVNGELKAVKGKLDNIMSLLLNIGNGKNQAVPSDPVPQSRSINGDVAAAAATAEGGGGGGMRFGGGGNGASFITAEPPAVTARGGYRQWGSGSIRRGGHDPYSCGTVYDYRPTPRLPVDQQQHGWQGHILHSQLPQPPSDAGRYPVVPNQTRYHVMQPGLLPSLGEAVAARASESASIGPSRQQLPPLYLSPSRVSESAASSSSEHKQGDKDNNSPKSSPPHRGDGSGGGTGGGDDTSPSSGSANTDPHDAQPQLNAAQLAPKKGTKTNATPEGGGQRGAVTSEMQQGLSDGTTSMLQVLSQSAAAVTEKDKLEKSVNRATTSGSSSSSSSGTQSWFEYR